MWFNRKSTDFSTALERLEHRLDVVIREQDAEKTANKRNLLEFAELGEKMRRVYLRIARRQKIESDETSPVPENDQNEQPALSAREIRDAIESKWAAGGS